MCSKITSVFTKYKNSFYISRKVHSGRVACAKDTKEPKGEVSKCKPTFEGGCIPDPFSIDPNCEQPKVVIVGGGMAGISAAHRLVKCGIRDVKVVEALERPGGRIRTLRMGGKPVELGAQWIDGCCIANPVYTLANQEGLLNQPIQRMDPRRGVFFRSSGEAIEPKLLISVQEKFEGIVKEAQLLYSLSWEDPGSLQNFMDKGIEKSVAGFPESQRVDARCIFNALLNDIRCRWGEDLSKMAAAQFGSFKKSPYENSYLPSGFDAVLAPLIKSLPEDCLMLKREVSSIRWGPSGNISPRAIIECTNGEICPADYIIVTLPLGVLKMRAHKLFSPPLPDDRLDCIRKLGFGFISKIFLEYDKPFWICNEGYIKMTWTLDELAISSEWVKSVGMIEEVPGCPSTLMCSVGGKEAIYIEDLPEVRVAEEMTALLRKFLQDPTIPFPKRVLKSKWASSNYFCGAVSYMGLESLEGHQITLGSPLPIGCHPIAPILFFAGEATCPGHFSTVHGARLSGLREADRILELTKSFGGPPKCEDYIVIAAP